MCFMWIWEQTAVISLYNINWLVFITETVSVYCAVRTGSLNIIQVNLSLQMCNFALRTPPAAAAAVPKLTVKRGVRQYAWRSAQRPPYSLTAWWLDAGISTVPISEFSDDQCTDNPHAFPQPLRLRFLHARFLPNVVSKQTVMFVTLKELSGTICSWVRSVTYCSRLVATLCDRWSCERAWRVAFVFLCSDFIFRIRKSSDSTH